ncbi:MAG TPA: DoxX family protein [Gemmatimonadaceae bacterium]|nr:DoxX family protein [Gemmatimonadaceae bacterium]
MPTTDAIDTQLLDLGLLVVRVILGLIFAAHGAQKLFGWFGGYGLAGTGGFMETLGFRPGTTFATAAAIAEFFGGLLLALGFLGPIGPALMISVMIVAMVTVHSKNPFFVATNGIEHPLMFTATAFGLALTGPGRYSVDAVLGTTRWETPRWTWIILAIGIVGGFLNLMLRRQPPAARSA